MVANDLSGSFFLRHPRENSGLAKTTNSNMNSDHGRRNLFILSVDVESGTSGILPVRD
jgi:hypothetical protein